MLTPRRVFLVLLGLVLVAVAWTGWTAWRTERDLRTAEQAVDRLQAALETGDDAARDAAVADLQDAAASAHGRTDGWWWAGMTKLPVYGDDAAGVRALSASVDVVAQDAVGPLVSTVDSLDQIVADGRIDPALVADLDGPVSGAAEALREASALVAAHDPDGFVGPLRTRYADYADKVSGVADGLVAAGRAIDVLPGMLGADGPRDYLFVFQNNAEARSTGGLPGSWARVHAEDGKLELVEQGTGSDFRSAEQVAELTPEEVAVYDELPGLYFQDANFIPDFPRAAQLWNEFWAAKYPRVGLDGVLSLDPVGMSYLMAGTGPVQVGDLTLTADTIVPELLNNTYLTVTDPVAQDERFKETARALFAASTSDLASPVEFVRGLQRAIDEGRLRVAPFDDAERNTLAGTAILGALSGDDGATPHVDVGVNDATGSKMSYYLRYDADVSATSCEDGRQQLEASMTLNQLIDPADAKSLPDYVSGGGEFGIDAGSQLVALRIYGPFGGAISDVRINDKKLDPELGNTIAGRPVVTVAPLIDSLDDVVVTWDMTTGPDQTGPGELGLTPGVVPGSGDSTFATAC